MALSNHENTFTTSTAVAMSQITTPESLRLNMSLTVRDTGLVQTDNLYSKPYKESRMVTLAMT